MLRPGPAEPAGPGSSLPPRPDAARPARLRRSRPAVLLPARALAGAGVAVAGVCLGIGTLLWATDAPAVDPAVSASAVVAGDEPAVALPGDEPATGSAAAEPPPPAATLPEPEPEPEPEPVLEAAPEAPVAADPPPADVAPVPVLVLNNSRLPGLAARSAAGFERAGWPVRDTGDLRGRIRATTVYYPPGQEAAARAFADRFEGVERVLPRLAGLPGSGLTVVVTRDFRP